MGNVISKPEKPLTSNTIIHKVETIHCSKWQHNSNGCIGNSPMATICTRSDGNNLLSKNCPGIKIPYLTKKINVKGKSELTAIHEINNLISNSLSTSINIPLEIPPLETPPLEIPPLEIPPLETPQLEIPPLEIPPLEIPPLEIPQLELPQLELPRLELPRLGIPLLEIPPLKIPPFESPTIVEILLNFCLYKYHHNFPNFKVAIKTAVAIIQLYESWEWITPENLPNFKPFPHSNSYLYYYERYLRCFSLTSGNPIYKITTVFGRDVLRYTLNAFQIHLTNLFNTEVNNWTFSKRNFYKKLLPSFISNLENEVYAPDSPIWILNLKNMYNENLNMSSIELRKQTSSESCNIINNKDKKKCKVLIEVLKHIDIPDFITTDMNNVIEVLNLVNLDYITYSKGFIISPQKLQIQRQQRLRNERPVIALYKTGMNSTKIMLWHNELKTIYQTQIPRIPDNYIVRLESDKKIETMAIIVNDLPVGAIYFRTYASKGFTEIVLCIFKRDLHTKDIDTKLMNCFKHHNIQMKIYNLITCIEYNSVVYFKRQKFKCDVDIKYAEYVQQYPYASLMHCILKEPNKKIL